MKKLLILVIALALIGGVAMAQVTIGGRIDTTLQNSFDDETGDARSNVDARVEIGGQVDEYNSLAIRIRFDVGGTQGPELGDEEVNDFRVDRAHFTTDVGALVGTDDVGLGIKTNVGWNEFDYTDVAEIDAYVLGGLYAAEFTNLGAQFSFDVLGMVNAYAAVGLNANDLLDNSEDATEYVMRARTLIGLDTAIDVGVGTAVGELVYSYVPGAIGNGHLGVAGGLVDAMFVEDLGLSLVTAWTLPLGAEGIEDEGVPTFIYNATLSAAYAGLVKADFVLTGYEESVTNSLGIGLGVTPLDFLSLQAGVGIALDTDDDFTPYMETLNSFDASLLVKAGAASFRFGYFWLAENDDTGADLYEPAILTNEFAPTTAFSGLYIRARVNY